MQTFAHISVEIFKRERLQVYSSTYGVEKHIADVEESVSVWDRMEGAYQSRSVRLVLQ